MQGGGWCWPGAKASSVGDKHRSSGVRPNFTSGPCELALEMTVKGLDGARGSWGHYWSPAQLLLTLPRGKYCEGGVIVPGSSPQGPERRLLLPHDCVGYLRPKKDAPVLVLAHFWLKLLGLPRPPVPSSPLQCPQRCLAVGALLGKHRCLLACCRAVGSPVPLGFSRERGHWSSSYPGTHCRNPWGARRPGHPPGPFGAPGSASQHTDPQPRRPINRLLFGFNYFSAYTLDSCTRRSFLLLFSSPAAAGCSPSPCSGDAFRSCQGGR